MASTLPETNPCCPVCGEEVSVQVAGPTGAAGAAGTDGTDGTNAFTTTQESFNMPSEGGDTSSIEVGDSTWMTPNQAVYVQSAGWMQVRSKADATHVVLRNLEDTGNSLYTENVAPTTNVPSSSQISPGGVQGPAGTAASGTAPDDASYWTRTSEGDLSGESAIDSLSDGVLQHTGGVPSQAPLATAVEALGSNGLVTRTSSSAASSRTITGTTDRIDVTDGDGVSGNPTLDVGSDVYVSGGTDVAVSDGGTGASNQSGARSNLGLSRAVGAYMLFEHQESSGTNGGGISDVTWTNVGINTEVEDTGNNASISSNIVTLDQGIYRFRAWHMAFKVDAFQLRLFNNTTSTAIKYGSSSKAASAQTESYHGIIQGRFTISAATETVQLEMFVGTANGTDGLGTPGSHGVIEIFGAIEFWKEAE